MKFIFTVFILSNFALISVDALPANGSKIEANHGEDVTLSFTMDKAEEAEQMKIIFTSETTNETRVIARHCAVSDNCHAEETDGVKLLVGKGLVNVTIQKVNSSRAGLYKVDPVVKGIPAAALNPITLVVNDASPNSSNLFGLCALFPLVISVGRLLL